jgi:hypothetical protein
MRAFPFDEVASARGTRTLTRDTLVRVGAESDVINNVGMGCRRYWCGCCGVGRPSHAAQTE